MAARTDNATTTSTPEQDWRAVFLAALEQSPNVTVAAKQAGRNRQHVYRVRAEDPEFAAAWDSAIEAGVDAVEETAFRMATGENANPTLVQFILKTRRRETYGDKQEISHKGAIGIAPATMLDVLTDLGHRREDVLDAMREYATNPEGMGEQG